MTSNRDVILRALQDWCWIGEAPLHLRALDSYDLERMAEVAAGAVEATDGPYAAKTFYSLSCEGCKAEFEAADYDGILWMEDKGDLLDAAENDGWNRQDDGRVLCDECRVKPGGDLYEDEDASPPVGTPAEADACAGRSGLGEVGA